MELVHRTAHLGARSEHGGFLHLFIEDRTHAGKIAAFSSVVCKSDALLGDLIGVRVATGVGTHGDGSRNVAGCISHGVFVVAFENSFSIYLWDRLIIYIGSAL